VVRDDAEIFAESVRDPERFEEIFQRHYDSLLRYARQRIGHDIGEEIAERTMVIAFEQRESYDRRFPSAKGWLFGIATNLIRHHVRDEHTHLLALGRLPIDPDVADIVDAERLDAERERPVLADALARLSKADREAFLLSVLAGLTYPEIATAARVPLGTVRSRIHRARRQLREQLGSSEAIAGIEDDRGTDA
jgi:RNA polymerase sigma factor (sigma-70 family)